MPDSISTIQNLGPAIEESFARAEITSANELRDMGADAGYLRLLQSGARPYFYCLLCPGDGAARAVVE